MCSDSVSVRALLDLALDVRNGGSDVRALLLPKLVGFVTSRLPSAVVVTD